MNPDTTPTPRTDAYLVVPERGIPIVPTSFARQLERELAEKTNEVERLRELVEWYKSGIESCWHAANTYDGNYTAACDNVMYIASKRLNHKINYSPAPEKPNQFRDAAKMVHPLMNCQVCGEFRGHGHECAPEPQESVTGLCLICHENQTTCSSGLCRNCFAPEESVWGKNGLSEPEEPNYPEQDLPTPDEEIAYSKAKELTHGWRELGPDEVVCEGDERISHPNGLAWRKAETSIGTIAGKWRTLRFRTRRSLPNKGYCEPAPKCPNCKNNTMVWQEKKFYNHWMCHRAGCGRPIAKKEQEVGLAKMLECFIADYPDAGKAIYDAIYNIRNDIQKLKLKTND